MSVTPQDLALSVNPEFKGKMMVGNISGGKETNPMWTSQVETLSFRGALEKSIAVAGYRSNDSSANQYTIDAVLQNLNQPLLAINFDVVSTVIYTVTGYGKQKQFPVVATGTAFISDTLVGMERLRIANERSIKENIKQFLQKLSLQAGL